MIGLVKSTLIYSGGPANTFNEFEEKNTVLSRNINNAEILPAVSENGESRIEADRERFLARRGQK